jgi:hypothetical protein
MHLRPSIPRAPLADTVEMRKLPKGFPDERAHFEMLPKNGSNFI